MPGPELDVTPIANLVFRLKRSDTELIEPCQAMQQL
jgi:hypothetical protein